MRIVQALHWLHDMKGGQGDDRTLLRLRRLLNDSEQGPRLKSDLREGLSTLPAWMQVLLKPLLTEDASDTDITVSAPNPAQLTPGREAPSQ
jgi:hypothetical protein